MHCYISPHCKTRSFWFMYNIDLFSTISIIKNINIFPKRKNLPILTDAGFRDTTGDINVEIMMKMSIHFLIAILLPFDGLFSPPVLHSFVFMIFAQYRNYSRITCKLFVTLSKAKWLGNCVYTCLTREKKLMTNYKITTWSLFSKQKCISNFLFVSIGSDTETRYCKGSKCAWRI